MAWSEPRGGQRRAPQRVSESNLAAAAARYLNRFWAPSAALRRVLMKRVAAAAAWHGEDPAQGAALVEALIGRLLEAGVLDDGNYAAERARQLHEHGLPGSRIRQRLREKGVGAEHIDAALAAVHRSAQETDDDPDGDGHHDPDLIAAVAYARRRRLGPHRPPEQRAERYQKDLAAMARAGFSYDVARRVISANDKDNQLVG